MARLVVAGVRSMGCRRGAGRATKRAYRNVERVCICPGHLWSGLVEG